MLRRPSAGTTAAGLVLFPLIYNPQTDCANKPDVTVEYNFCAKAGGAEKFFNKTDSQSLNARTLRSPFDPAAGDPLQRPGRAADGVPRGDYRLEIHSMIAAGTQAVTSQARKAGDNEGSG